jgi:hypothetical protein
MQVIKMRFRSLVLQGTPFINSKDLKGMIDSLFTAEWIAYLKKSFQGEASVIEYLARDTHRIAFSNHRIVSIKDSIVRFKYRDYADKKMKRSRSLRLNI